MDVDQLKENIMKIKKLFMVQKNLYERILTYLKEKAPLCAVAAGITNKQQQKIKRIHP